MRLFTLTVLIIFFISACNMQDRNRLRSGEKETDFLGKPSYLYACYDTTESGSYDTAANGIVKGRSNEYKSVTDAEESAYSDKAHLAAIKNKKFILSNDTVVLEQLQKILSELVGVRENPSAVKYSIHLVEDEKIRVSTLGGHIYFTKAMYDKCKGNADVLYFLIGHEIGHTERGHSKLNILEGQLYNMTRRGNNARSDTAFFPLSASPSNQRFEFEADYYGINLVNELQKDLCATVSFWKEMARDENEYDTFEGMFRTHPFSSQRAECLQVHLQHNFGINCSAR